MNTLRKTLGKHKRRIIRFVKGQPPKYQLYNRIHATLLKSESPVIFDVGAHHGESIERFHEAFPKATIHSFEADLENFQVMQNRFGGLQSVVLNQYAVGAEKGTKTFFKNLKSDTSSFNRVNLDSEWAKIRSAQYNVAPSAFTVKAYDLNLDTLDNYIEVHAITRVDILKMDT